MLLLLTLFFSSGAWAHCHVEKMAMIPGGTYTPFYGSGTKKAQPVRVNPFYLDQYPVTNSEFRNFLKKSPAWETKKVTSLLADAHYLEDLNRSPNRAPVTFVSWFAAKAYCESKSKTLPSTDQWEFAAYDEGRNANEINERALAWYSKPNLKITPAVGQTPKNGAGIYDLHGLIWEWTNDFNTPTGDGSALFCGGGSVGVTDTSNYVNYMRFSFRQSLKASYTTRNLGFRCAKNIEQTASREKTRVEGDDHGSIFDLQARWTTQDGEKVSLEKFKGYSVVMAMIYTSCSGACPMIVSDMKRIEKGLTPENRTKTKFVLVTFDHETDTPQKLLKYAKAQSLDLKRWTLLNGGEEDVRKLSALLDVRYKKIQTGTFEHSNLITVLDKDGRIRFQP